MTKATRNTQTFKTFKEVKEKYKIEKWFHTPWHFDQSGQYTCFLEGNKECYKNGAEYIVQNKR
jgi:hypothetical protein